MQKLYAKGRKATFSVIALASAFWVLRQTFAKLCQMLGREVHCSLLVKLLYFCYESLPTKPDQY
jgi:hypothetical protein